MRSFPYSIAFYASLCGSVIVRDYNKVAFHQFQKLEDLEKKIFNGIGNTSNTNVCELVS